MGFVGAGGIGQELVVAIRKFYYSDVSAILLMIIVTVFVIDIGTGWSTGPPVRQGRARMTPLPPAEQGAVAGTLSGFSRPASARLATPAMILAAAAIFLYGMVELDFRRRGF
jgi:hypothetical protein